MSYLYELLNSRRLIQNDTFGWLLRWDRTQCGGFTRPAQKYRWNFLSTKCNLQQNGTYFHFATCTVNWRCPINMTYFAFFLFSSHSGALAGVAIVKKYVWRTRIYQKFTMCYVYKMLSNEDVTRGTFTSLPLLGTWKYLFKNYFAWDSRNTRFGLLTIGTGVQNTAWKRTYGSE